MNHFILGFIIGAGTLAAIQSFVMWRMSRVPKAPKVRDDYWLICPCMKDGHA